MTGRFHLNGLVTKDSCLKILTFQNIFSPDKLSPGAVLFIQRLLADLHYLFWFNKMLVKCHRPPQAVILHKALPVQLQINFRHQQQLAIWLSVICGGFHSDWTNEGRWLVGGDDPPHVCGTAPSLPPHGQRWEADPAAHLRLTAAMSAP